ncbi:MAG: transcription termination/antitermination factor NusG [Oscillospiraceae bacterium]|nr:transcription termination/antitermination factor NusG [Oscillospiraceae bacterium]
MSEEAKWYVLHTYSGYENKVKATIEKIVENRNLGHLIQKVEVPVEEVVEGNKVTKRKIFPCYVMLKMVMNDETWYIGRNVVGSTGFVGPGSKPVPLSPREVEEMGIERIVRPAIELSPGDSVNIVSGPLEGFAGVVEEVDNETRKITVMVSMFGRDTPVEVDYSQIEKFE